MWHYIKINYDMFKLLKQIFNVISTRDRRRFIAIFFMVLGLSVLDLVGISSIVPIVSLLSAPNASEAIADNTLLRFLSFLFDTTEPEKLSIISLVFVIVVFFIRVVYAFILVYVKNKFTMSFNRRLTGRLMKIYLSMPYEYHHQNNSSTLIRKSTYDVGIFTNAVNGLITFVIQFSTMIAIIIYLFISSYIATLIIGIMLLLFSLLIIFVFKKRMKSLGKTIQELNNYNYQYLSQAFNGVKESKISNTEDFFVEQYSRNIANINHLTLKMNMFSAVPYNALEFVGILGMVLSLFMVIFIGGSANYHIISTFSVFAYAVIKLLPCVSGVASFVNTFSFYSSSVTSIQNDLEEVKNLESEIETYGDYEMLAFNNSIDINNISFAYKDDLDKKIINNISFTIRKNTSVAISGKSGAGKTTLIDIILGLLKPTEGSIFCDGIDVNSNVRGWRDNISYVPQNIFLMDDTIRNNVMFGLDTKNADDRKIWDALDKAQLKEFVEQSPNGLDTVIGERGIRLSGGQRQRIGIARAFYRNTNIIVLDEATSALDYETEKNILDHISKYSVDHTLIIITHRLNTIESCDYIYQIIDGKVKRTKGS